MVTVKWKHSASTNQWRGADGLVTRGFVVLNRPLSVPLKKIPIRVPVHILASCSPVLLLNLYHRQCSKSTARSSFTSRWWMPSSMRIWRTAPSGYVRPVSLVLYLTLG